MANTRTPTYNPGRLRGPSWSNSNEKGMPVIYDLQCDAGHRFEGWFKNAEEYAQQQEDGLLACPRCACPRIQRLPTASHVGSASGAEAVKAAQEMAVLKEKSDTLMAKIHAFVDRHFEDVGTAFAEEARRIHYGEVKERNIRGQATATEVRALHEEGVDVLPLPAPAFGKSKLN